MTTDRKRAMSDLGYGRNPLQIHDISPVALAQSCATHCARPNVAADRAPTLDLGAPLSIREVARMLGCSPWTVRQQHLPRGLPHFRSGPNGKLIFFRDQVVAWILTQQKKRGNR